MDFYEPLPFVIDSLMHDLCVIPTSYVILNFSK